MCHLISSSSSFSSIFILNLVILSSCFVTISSSSYPYSPKSNRCPKGFEGPNCEINIDDCAHNLCENGATCIDGINDYSCQCTPQFTGLHCSIDVDECSLSQYQCRNGATCLNKIDGYRCICVGGWTGPDCSVNIDDCVGSPCKHGGTCVDMVGYYKCECPPHRTGLYCQFDNVCHHNPCGPGSRCSTSPVDGTYKCVCGPGYTGVNCTEDIDECKIATLNPCAHGTCVNTPGSYKCECANGYTGDWCEENINECDSSPCQNDGTCLDERGGYRCICMLGFTGRHCETDINECSDNPCLNGGSCSDLINSFRCLCPEGFTGIRCEQNENDCFSDPCLNGGSCIDEIAGFSCQCQPGFTGKTCDIDIDDCSSNPCHHGKCIDQIGGFSCSCDPGYQGRLCQVQINECLSNPCLYGGTCRDLIDGFNCECPKGTSGTRCEVNTDECWSNPCRNGATCHDKINGFTCECPPGFSGTTCEMDIDECASNPCANGGTCHDLVNSFKCSCPRGFFGSRCLNDYNECESNPCYNGGSCATGAKPGSFICHCPPGYTGIRCQSDVNECVSGPCLNGGKCNNLESHYTCSCPPGFTGFNCETNINECLISSHILGPVCLNGGTCYDQVNNFTCLCAIPFTGRRCETEINPCSGNKCQNGATCTILTNFRDYQCTCPTGFTGHYCENDIDECSIGSVNPCRYGDKCVNLRGSYRCDPSSPSQSPSSNLPIVKEEEIDCAKHSCHPRCPNKEECYLGNGNPWFNCSLLNFCYQRFSNGICNPECNNRACLYDGKDCPTENDSSIPPSPSSSSSSPSNRGGSISGKGLPAFFPEVGRGGGRGGGGGGGSERGGGRGGKCNEKNDYYCLENYGNGFCDSGCDSAECGYDGLDCFTGHRIIGRGELFIVVDMPYDELVKDNVKLSSFLRELSRISGSILRIKRRESGEKEISRYVTSDGELWSNLSLVVDNSKCYPDCYEDASSLASFFAALESRGKDMGQPSMFQALSVVKVQSSFNPSDMMSGGEEKGDSRPSWALVIACLIGSCIIIAMIIQVAIKVNGKNKVAGTITWFPEGFIAKGRGSERGGRCRGDSGGENGGGYQRSVSTYGAASGDFGRVRNKSSNHGGRRNSGYQTNSLQRFNGRSNNYNQSHYYDDGQELRMVKDCSAKTSVTSIETKTETIYEEPHDPRAWTNAQHHYEAYTGDTTQMIPPPIVKSELIPYTNNGVTPMSPESSGCLMHDDNIVGPDGLTALMIFSAYGESGAFCESDGTMKMNQQHAQGGQGGMTTTNSVNDDVMMIMSPNIKDHNSSNPDESFKKLLQEQKDIDKAAEKTGETCLHLAARHARADAAKRLLTNGANCNAIDSTGRTPLHTAIGADARGVFELLLRHRATDLNAKTNDGTTPLILAARLACEGMLNDLIQAEADVNACDETGRTALHWAASVNNVDAVRLLLSNNANRDAQDHEECTPLFLAAREGSYQAVRVLLENSANKDITDHMDRYPRDVAAERMHNDIVELLDTFKQDQGNSHSQSSSQQTSQNKPPPSIPPQQSNSQKQEGSSTLKRSHSIANSCSNVVNNGAITSSGTLKVSRSRKSAKTNAQPYSQKSNQQIKMQSTTTQQQSTVNQPQPQQLQQQQHHHQQQQQQPPPPPPPPPSQLPQQHSQQLTVQIGTQPQTNKVAQQSNDNQIKQEVIQVNNQQQTIDQQQHQMQQVQSSIQQHQLQINNQLQQHQQQQQNQQIQHQLPPTLPKRNTLLNINTQQQPMNSPSTSQIVVNQQSLQNQYDYLTLSSPQHNMPLSPPHSYVTNPSPHLLSPHTPSSMLSPPHNQTTAPATPLTQPPPTPPSQLQIQLQQQQQQQQQKTNVMTLIKHQQQASQPIYDVLTTNKHQRQSSLTHQTQQQINFSGYSTLPRNNNQTNLQTFSNHLEPYYMTPSPDSPETWSTQALSPQGINDWHDSATIYSTPQTTLTTTMTTNGQQITYSLPPNHHTHHNHHNQHQLISELTNSHQMIATTATTTTTTEPMLTDLISMNHREPNVNPTAAVFI